MLNPDARTLNPLRVALIGNPNTGKSTLFSALVGVHQHVGNYPGVTVEKKTGRFEIAGRQYELIDLPGLYSLAPRSRDEMVAVEVLLGRRQEPPPDAVLCVLDATNLHRNLYLVSQVLELGLPTVLVVNMLDVAKQRGIALDMRRLRQQLGLSVVAVQANRKIGLAELKAALAEVSTKTSVAVCPQFPAVFEQEVAALKAVVAGDDGRSETASYDSGRAGFQPAQDKLETRPTGIAAERGLPPFLLRRLLLDASGYLQGALFPTDGDRVARWLETARTRLADRECPIPQIETTVRYEWARRMLDGVVAEPAQYPTNATDRVDRVLTHRLWGALIFAAVMAVMFQAVFVWAKPAMGWIDAGCRAAGHWLESQMAEGALRSLLVDGAIGGVGSVLSFLPQILVLFAFIGVLEDCGYMARAAFLMDRLMARVGLSGKSFIPMLSSFACAVPGIMATRVIENPRDRLTTILVMPLLTCSARLPVYALLIAAFIPQQTYLGGLVNLQGLTLAGLYLLGIVAAVAVALVLKRTILRGAAPPFVLELPAYHWPSPRAVAMRVLNRCRVFLATAGTLILAMSILVWAAMYYPHGSGNPRDSILGHVGRLIEPAVKPLGWDWRIGCAVVASLPARELVVATMGVIYSAGDDAEAVGKEDETRLQERLHAVTWEGTGKPVFCVPVALGIMVFFALCAQCVATLAVIRRETNSWRWPAFTFAYMTALAYTGALITYQVGMWISG